MEITPKSRFWLRAQGIASTLLFLAVIGTLAWLSTRYEHQSDWTASGRNTLTEDSRKLLAELKEPIRITAFVRDNNPLRKSISELVARYQRVKPDIQLEFVNPDTNPEQVRELGIGFDGELLLRYQGRSEKVQQLNEQQISNALLRLAGQGERWILFLAGHGERDPLGTANHDLGQFGQALRRMGLQVQSLNLTQQ
ncbi:MAG TPA: Gldg family protein, partial [Gammaproteobacteria bacterium]